MNKGAGIKVKTAIMAVFFMGLLTAAIAMIGYKHYRDSVLERYTTYAETVLEYAYRVTLPYSFGDMIAEREMPADYELLRSELNTVKDSSEIEYLYAVYFEDLEDIHSLHYAINAKSQEELSSGVPLSELYTLMGKPCVRGEFEDDTLTTFQQAVKSGMRKSGTLVGYAVDYGAMLNGYHVIFDSEDHAVGLICVEIDINHINTDLHRYLRAVALTATVYAALIILVYMLNTQRYLIGPIERIAASSDDFVRQMNRNTDPKDLVFQDTRVKAGGELALLAENVKSLADSVAVYMTNLKLVTAEKERIGAELSIATQIQADMLPRVFPPFPERHDFDIYATMTPAREVGGDFYDFFLIDDDHLGLVMADVSGKGVPAALFMVNARTLIKNRAMMGGGPAEILHSVNEQLCQGNEAELFVTVWLAIVELSTGKGLAANAGHEHPAIRRADGSFELAVYRHSLAVAAMEGVRFREHDFTLRPGDSLFVYTDGVTEATDAKNQLFGTDRMLAALNRDPAADPGTLLKNVQEAIDTFVGGAPQFEDITMMCLHYSGSEANKMRELTVEAKIEKLDEVLSFVDEQLEALDCPMKAQMQLDVAVEEIFVNIASYAYAPGVGSATVRFEPDADRRAVTLTFIDRGVPYDPLQKADPDVTLSAEERSIGGLGIYMVKKTMDDVSYAYREEQNILTIRKTI